MTLTTIAPVITDAGVIAPTYYEVVEFLKAEYRAIYGPDAYLDNDSQDGQWIGVIARVITDCGAACVDAVSTFSPKTATKEALSRNVAINGIKRAIPTFSTVDLTIGGTPGTAISNGYSPDRNGNKWMLPTNVIIPPSGSIVVSATAEKAGAILAVAGSINTTGKPTRGWKSVINLTPSTLGMPIESDSKLRQRQALSVANSAVSLEESARGKILELEGVTRCRTFSNTKKVDDANGIPANSFCAVVYGGDSQEIAKVIKSKKSMGCALYGNTNITLLNVYNEPEVISFYRATVVNISYLLSIVTNEAYSADTAEKIKALLAEYTNDLGIGDKITHNKLVGVSNLYGAIQSQTYEVTSIQIKADGVVISGDYTLPFGSVAFCDPTSIEVVITSE
ncbi:baseplate J/gp47 family protein [Acinetobacter sp. ANC 4648]|uniref:baseplate J/gp47 family protein n=1 Tax=Acinetobacter sp. ANC 4648 TaxID=1977875 RepID=UPI000A352FAA|nr:baseplate J/gp47 family protein [Acinetobacter sp. ANC 4648]OTG82340.1 phage baseplate protein [Acinetobacter sp. ANC 4648]